MSLKQVRCKNPNCQTVLGNRLDNAWVLELANKKSVFIKATNKHKEIYQVKCSACGFEFFEEDENFDN